MRIGPLEIALIIAVIIAIAIIARVVRTGSKSAGQKATVSQPGGNIGRLYGFFNRTGIVLIIAGTITLIAAASLFRWILQSYLWASLIIAIGLVFIFFARKKR